MDEDSKKELKELLIKTANICCKEMNKALAHLAENPDAYRKWFIAFRTSMNVCDSLLNMLEELEGVTPIK